MKNIIILSAVLLQCFMFSHIEAQNKTPNTYTHSIGLGAALDLRVWAREGSGNADFLFSFSQRGFLPLSPSDAGNKSLSPLWNLIPYYELGVNNKFFFKLEHFCTYRDVLRNNDPHSRNHGIYAHFRYNTFSKLKKQRHKLLVGGILGTNIYREKRIDETKYDVGLAPALLVGISYAYYYNFAHNFDMFFSIDHSISFGKGYEVDPVFGALSFIRMSTGLQYSFR